MSPQMNGIGTMSPNFGAGESPTLVIAGTNPKYWIDFRRGVTLSGNEITVVVDQASAVSFSRIGTGPTLTTDAAFNGQPVASLAATNRALNNSGPGSTAVQNTIVVLAKSTNAIDPSRLAYFGYGNIYAIVSGRWGAYNGGVVQSDAAMPTGTAQALTILSTNYNNVTLIRNGTSVGPVLTGVSEVARQTGGISWPGEDFEGTVATAIYWERVLNAGELSKVSKACQDIWGRSL
jgi:hypothetical protein